MNDTITLFGYRYSVYTRIVRLVLMHKHVSFEIEEVDPFGPLPEGYDKIPSLWSGSRAAAWKL